MCNDTATTAIYTFPTRRSSDLPRWKPRAFCHRSKNCIHVFPSSTIAERAMVPAATSPLYFSSPDGRNRKKTAIPAGCRSEEHTSELQSRQYLVCRLLLEKKKTQ